MTTIHVSDRLEITAEIESSPNGPHVALTINGVTASFTISYESANRLVEALEQALREQEHEARLATVE